MNNHKQTALHMSAAKDHSTICTILIENGVKVDAKDDSGNTCKSMCGTKGFILKWSVFTMLSDMFFKNYTHLNAYVELWWEFLE